MMEQISRIFSLDRHKHPIDRLAKINALVSGVALYPQLFKAISTGDVFGFSLFTYILISVNSLVWLIYAMHRKLVPLLVSSILNAFAGVAIIYLILVS